MAKSSGRVAVFQIDNSGGTPVDFSDYVDSVDFGVDIEMLDVTTIGDDAERVIEGTEGWEIGISGPFDPTVLSHMNGIKQLGSSSTATYSPAGTGGGSPKIEGECFLRNLQVNTGAKARNAWSATVKGDDAVTLGTH